MTCVEGEKAADRLSDLGLRSCCPPFGASQWLPEWSGDLAREGCEELVILPDADDAGTAHAERVAAVSSGRFAIKVVRLPGLIRGADAYDWIGEGHDMDDLVNVVREAAEWTPGAFERARTERRRAKTRERVRRLRERRRAEQLADSICNAAKDQACNAVTL